MLPSSLLNQRGVQEGDGVGEAWPTPHLTQQLILLYCKCVVQVRWRHTATAYHLWGESDWPTCRHLPFRHLKLDEINSTLVSSEGTLKRPIKPFKTLASIEIMPQKQLAECLNSYKVSLNPNKKSSSKSFAFMIVISTALFLVLILLITFALRHRLISLLKAVQHHERLFVIFFFKLPNIVLKLSYFVHFSLTGLSHYLWGTFLTLFNLFLSFHFD